MISKLVYTFGILIYLFVVVSCDGEEERKLQEKLAQPLPAPKAVLSLNSSSVEQYRDVELAYNENFILQLKKLLDNGFEEQLDEFEKNELGFFASYGHMFDYLFLNDIKLKENWQVKSSKYFNSIDVEVKAAELYQHYLSDVRNIRSNFHKSAKKINLPQYERLNLPMQEIYLGYLQEHSRNNLMIELGVEMLIWILVLGVVAVLSLLVAVPTRGLSMIVFVLNILASAILSIHNDNKLLDSLRKQHTATPIEYIVILDKLNQNTHTFYGK